MAEQQILDCLSKHKITIESEFVPFSRSRYKDNKDPSLNWVVTVLKDNRKVLSTDYMAGSGHCPSDKRFSKDKYIKRKAIEVECENGKEATWAYGDTVRATVKPILPDICSVLACLVADSDVLNYSCFEDWAENFGYEADSRKAEKTYRDCLETALALRNGLGEKVLAELMEACSDY